MAKQQTLDKMIADTYKRSPLTAALPYVVLGFILATLFVWRVAVTDPNWDASPQVTSAD